MTDYTPEETRDTWDRIFGYAMNALAGIGALAMVIFLSIALGYWSAV